MPSTFFETKVRFLMAGPPHGDIFLSGQATTLGQSELAMAVVAKVVSRTTASHETDLSSKLRSRCGAAPIFGFVCCRRIPWPAQHSVRLPCIFRGGRSMFCADASDAWQAQHFRKQGL